MLKEKVIWGAGINGGRFASGFGNNEISFFIDNDIRKNGCTFCGLKVYHPTKIGDSDWKKYYIYIPEIYYDEISHVLREKGLEEKKDYTIYGHTLSIRKEKADDDFILFKERLKQVDVNKRIPYFASHLKKHGYGNFIAHISKLQEKYVIISEMIWSGLDDDREQINIPIVQAPIFADYETLIDAGEADSVRMFSEEEKKIIDEAVEHLRGYFPKESYQNCYYTVLMKYKYIKFVLDYFSCDKLICSDSVSVEHSILQKLCRERSIKVIYTHAGIIHGTLSMDAIGEVGESLPALVPERFNQLYVDFCDLSAAKSVKEYLVNSRLNRKVQPKNSISELLEKMDSSKRTVFFAGQNDVGSHMIPYTEITKSFYSPIFKSSIEAAIFLAKISEKNQWNFIYKPHPMYVHAEERDMLPPSACYIEYGDINDIIDLSDVVVTILSTTCYDALVRDKAVVMLGYTQAKGKGITYEAFQRDEIEDTINDAIEFGLTTEMKENYIRHLAQLLKYYLYDNGENRPVRYGQSFPDSFDGFFKLYEMIGGEVDGIDKANA